MAKTKENTEKNAVRKSKTLDIKELLIPRMRDEVADPNSPYLHYRALLLLFWDIFPEGAIEVYPTEDNQVYITMECSVWENRNDVRPMVVTSYKQMYTDDVCDTYLSCKALAIRAALLECGIGAEYELEEERKRREEKMSPVSNIDSKMSTAEMFDSMADISDQAREKIKEEPAEAEEKKETTTLEEEIDQPAAPKTERQKAMEAAYEQISVDPFAEQGVGAEEPPKKKRGRPKKEDVAKEGAEEAKDSKKTSPEESAAPTDPSEYIIREGDILQARYAGKYTGVMIKNIGLATLKTMLTLDGAASEEFKKILSMYIEGKK